LAAGSLLVTTVPDHTEKILRDLLLAASRLGAAPSVTTHAVMAPRTAFLRTWLSTQPDGWWRYVFDTAAVRLHQHAGCRTEEDLQAKYDVIIFPRVGRSALDIINGFPDGNNPMPWQKSDLSPNLGAIDSAADIRSRA
jgi:hypothetical protein